METVDDDDDDKGANEEATADDAFTKGIKKDILRSAREEAIRNGEPLPTIDTSDLLNRTFINNPDKEGVQVRVKIEDISATDNRTTDGQKQLFCFRCKIGEDTFEEIMTYNKMLEWCECNQDKDDFFKVKEILNHRKNKESTRGYDVLL